MKILKKAVLAVSFCVTFLFFVGFDFRSTTPEAEILPNFSHIRDIEERKQQFFAFMRPIVLQENAKVLKQRIRVLKLYEKRKRGEMISLWDQQWIKWFIVEYQIENKNHLSDETWELLKKRVDIVPPALVLAQSANESAWGTSRFAIQGNSMFGQLTFSPDSQGIIPNRRDPGANHMVARYESVRQSVRSYLKNLNTHPAYVSFRDLRMAARSNGEIPDGYGLVEGLIEYSERREAYIHEIRGIISTNKSKMGLE